MNTPVTLQDLIDFAKKHSLDPSNCFILIAEECMTGDDHCEALVDPKVVKDKKVWDSGDGFLSIPLSITLKKLYEEL